MGDAPAGQLERDQHYMRLALALAEEASRAGEVPIGAVVVQDGAVTGRGANRTRRDGVVSAHAEIVALEEAERRSGDFRLVEAALYVTVEPCLMCLGAIQQARVTRLVYGVAEPKFGALTGPFKMQNHAIIRKLEISAGVLADEAASLLSGFFTQLRGE